MQDLLAQAGALLFRDAHVHKKISVLSGGERARVCLAGLLLGTYNILVLDEPGNHLDVETVETLADALLAYKGMVIFTSHDRHFMRRVATSVVEVRDGRVRNYIGDYDAYLYAMNKEIDEGERQQKSRKSNKPVQSRKEPKDNGRENSRKRGRVKKESDNIERKISRLDEQKRALNSQLLNTTDAEEAMRLHEQVTAITAELSEAEERWCELQQEMND